MASRSWQNRLLAPALKRTFKPLAFPRRPTAGKLGARATLSRQLERLAPYMRGATVEPVTLPHCSAEWVSPQHHADRVVLQLHGGGYTIFSPRFYRDFNVRLGTAAKAKVLAVNYRKAGKHAWPAPVDDVVHAYQHLLDLGYRNDQIVMVGDSAGGHLTLCTLLALRDRQLPMPAGGIAASPWANLAGDFPAMDENRHRDVILHADAIRALGRFHARGKHLKSPEISPAFASYEGLPPLFLLATDCEILRDDVRAVRDAALRAGVTVRYHEAQGLPHAYPSLSFILPEARQAVSDMADFIHEVTAPVGRS